MAIAHASRSIWEGTSSSTLSETFDAGSATDKVLLVVIRHGSSGAAKTHNTPTYNGVSMTQVGSLLDISTSGVTRKMSVWKLDNPASGSNTLAGGFSASVQQWSMEAIVVSGADSTNVVATTTAVSTNTPGATITAGASSSLIYLIVANSNGNADPYTPGSGVTEISDSTDAVTVTNHGWAIGYISATGSSQSPSFTASATGDHCAIAVEVTEAAVAAGIDFPDNSFAATFNSPTVATAPSNAFESELVAKGVQHYWAIDQVVGGKLIDKFGGVDLTVAGSPSQITGPTGILTGALRFDGVDDAATANAPSYLGPITVLMWLRTQALGQVTHDEAGFNSADTQRIGCGAFVQDDVAGTDTWEWHGANDLDAVYDLYGDAVVVDQWEFFATTIQTSGARFYQANGGTVVLKASDTTGDITESDFQVFRLMQGRAEVEFGRHDAAALAIFRSALTLTDIQDIFSAAQFDIIELNSLDGSATFNSPSLHSSFGLNVLDASASFPFMSLNGEVSLNPLDASATFNQPVLDSSLTLTPLDGSATFNSGHLAGTIDIGANDLSAVFLDPGVAGPNGIDYPTNDLSATFNTTTISGEVTLNSLDGSATFPTVVLSTAIDIVDNDLSAVFNSPVIGQSAIDLNVLDGSVTFNTMTLGLAIFYPDLDLSATFNVGVIGDRSVDLDLLDTVVFPSPSVSDPAVDTTGIYLPLKGTAK